MDTTESLGYLKGLLDGMDLDESKKETKIYRAMIGVLENLAEDVNDLTDGVEMMADQLDAVDEDLGDVEEYLYGDEDDDDCDCDCCDDDEDECQEFEIECPACHETFVVDEDTVLDGSMECPACGETVYVSEDDLDAGEANCAHCGVTFEVALEGDGEEDAEDGPVQYEVTCPDCGTTAVFEEDELLDGAPKCPNCGKPLDFEVTEE